MDQNAQPRATFYLTRLERETLAKLRDEAAQHDARAAAIRADINQHTVDAAVARSGVADGEPVVLTGDCTRILVFERPAKPGETGKPTPDPTKTDAPKPDPASKADAQKNGAHVHPPEPVKA